VTLVVTLRTAGITASVTVQAVEIIGL